MSRNAWDNQIIGCPVKRSFGAWIWLHMRSRPIVGSSSHRTFRTKMTFQGLWCGLPSLENICIWKSGEAQVQHTIFKIHIESFAVNAQNHLGQLYRRSGWRHSPYVALVNKSTRFGQWHGFHEYSLDFTKTRLISQIINLLILSGLWVVEPSPLILTVDQALAHFLYRIDLI